MGQGLAERVRGALRDLSDRAKQLIRAHLADARRGIVHGVFSGLGATAVSALVWWVQK
ncbi:hypothetical protein GCM10010360_61920 [Streptomyces nogalater]